jgi:hypothetical protein
MRLLTKMTCRRLRRRGTLARFAAGGRSDAHEWREVEAHIAVCAACAAEVADLRAVSALLRVSPPAEPTPGSLSARGELWSRLGPQISRTPQDAPGGFMTRSPVAEPDPWRAPSPRLERVASLLATPRPLPFAFAAAFGVGLLAVSIHAGHPGSAPTEQVAVLDAGRPIELTLTDGNRPPAGPRADALAHRDAFAAHALVAPAAERHPVAADVSGDAPEKEDSRSAADLVLRRDMAPPPTHVAADVRVPPVAMPEMVASNAGSAVRSNVAYSDAVVQGAAVDVPSEASARSAVVAGRLAPAVASAPPLIAADAEAANGPAALVPVAVAVPSGAGAAPMAMTPAPETPEMPYGRADGAFGAQITQTGEPGAGRLADQIVVNGAASTVDGNALVSPAAAASLSTSTISSGLVSDASDAIDTRAMADAATTLRRRRTLFLYASR